MLSRAPTGLYRDVAKRLSFTSEGYSAASACAFNSWSGSAGARTVARRDANVLHGSCWTPHPTHQCKLSIHMACLRMRNLVARLLPVCLTDRRHIMFMYSRGCTVRFFRGFLLCCLAGLSFASSAAGIFKCRDQAGKPVFTQNTADCFSHAKELTEVEDPKSGAKGETIDYRFPARAYVQEKGRWNVFTEEGLKDGNKALYRSSLTKLNETLDHVFSVMPTNARRELSTIKVFLLWGQASPHGGRKSGMSYIRKGEPDNYEHLDKRWEHALIVYSAENLMYLNELWSRKAIFHELAHAWHIVNWPEKHPPIFEAWKNARASNKFLNVRDTKGKTIRRAYAISNQLEYFAELSAMYFVGGNYFPFDKRGLKQYDPVGHGMVEQLWN